MELLLVRHAQPERVTASASAADPALTALGHRQAADLASWLAAHSESRPDLVVSSPMRRARETAEDLVAACPAPLRVDSRLAEFDLGATEYVPMEVLPADRITVVASALTTGRWGAHRFDPQEFRSRVREAFDDIVADRSANRVAVVCHGGVLNSFLSTLIGRPHGVFFLPKYTSVSRVVKSPNGPLMVESLNEVPHEPPGLP